MMRCAWITMSMLAVPAAAHATDLAGRRPDAPIIAFRATDASPRPTADFRVLPGPIDSELLPGDRSSAELCDVPVDRPREPGAAMRARMSMRLDAGRDAMRPAFALGGLGGALIRVTDALFDID
jgi:hypothetical protein